MTKLLERTPRRPKERFAKLRDFIASNSTLPCSISGCKHTRSDASIYCRKHATDYKEHGHPELKPPSPKVIAEIEKLLVDWLSSFEGTEKASLVSLWDTAVRGLRKHPRYAVSFSTLEGISGFTQKSKANVYLAHYQKNGHSTGNVMLRRMALSLWAELCFTRPQGKTCIATERTKWINLHTGKYVTRRSGFKKVSRVALRDTLSTEKWADLLHQGTPVDPGMVVEKTTYRTRPLAGVRRAIGAQVRTAVEHAVGYQWLRNQRLRDEALQIINKHSNGNTK